MQLVTSSGKPFRYKLVDDDEIIVYPSDANSEAQGRFALAITRSVVDLVKNQIRQKARVAMGASRDAPPRESLGALLKSHGQTRQQLSYLIPILEQQGYYSVSKVGHGYVVSRGRGV